MSSGRPSYEELVGLVVSQAETIGRLEVEVGELRAEVAELKRRLGQSSRNSSLPPSSDGLSKPAAKPRSLRRRSGREPGGQSGHEGHHLAQVEVPDEVVAHEPERCAGCGGGLEGSVLTGVERRQVFDLPPETRLLVHEHQVSRRRCGCGCETAGVFPERVSAPTQYGPRLRAFVLYLAVYQHIP
jgi:transposase